MADIFEDNDNEDIEFATKEWNKLNKSLEIDGLKDGTHEGRQSGLQKGFDSGFELSFKPFLTISSFEAIFDVLSIKLKTNPENEEISSQLKTIKSNLREIYVLIEKHLLNFDSNKLESNSIEMTEEIINLFNITKEKTIKICNQFNLESLLDLINNLSLLEPNIS